MISSDSYGVFNIVAKMAGLEVEQMTLEVKQEKVFCSYEWELIIIFWKISWMIFWRDVTTTSRLLNLTRSLWV